MKTVAALFVRHNSVYKTLPDVDAWDRDRDAWCWPGGMPAVVHPPCAQWGTLRHMANINLPEKALAIIAVQFIRTWGGVLEHPWRSALWQELELPPPGAAADRYGGWTLPLNQHCFGHRAEKRTKLYIVGCAPRDIPPMPMALGKAQFVVGTAGRRRDGFREAGREITKSEREHTPPLFAEWLVDLARRCKPGHSLVSSTKNQAATWSDLTDASTNHQDSVK